MFPFGVLPSSALALSLVAAAPLGAGPGAGAQENTGAGEGIAAEPMPGRSELVSRSGDLESEAEDARAQIARMRGEVALTSILQEAQAWRASIRDQLAALNHETYPRIDRIAQVREQAHLQRSEIEREELRLRERLRALEELRSRWIDRRAYWQAWQKVLTQESDPTAAGRKEFRRALALIGQVIDEVNGVYADLLRQQRAIAGVRGDLHSLEIHADDRIREGHRERWRRDAPPLPTAAFVERLAAVSFAEIREGIVGTPGIDPGFLDRVRWVIMVHLGLIAGLGLFLKRIRRHALALSTAGDSVGLLAGPWRTAIFVATAMLSFLYQPMPGLWEVGMLLVLAVTGAMIARQLLDPGERWLAYLLAAIYPPLFLLGVTAFPAPLFRLLLALLCLVGAPLLLRVAGRQRGLTRGARLLSTGLYAAAGILGAACVGEVAGFERLTRWLVESLVATAFVVYVLVVLSRLAGRVAGALAQVEARNDANFIERAGARFQGQLRWVFRGLMLAGGVLYAGSIWGVFDSATEIGAQIAAIEIRGGELRVRLGSVIAAGITVYLGYVLSWTVRTLLDIHVFEQRSAEAGVYESIKAIIHYTLVVLAGLAGLGALGVGLQSFALVFGALGVGIGFGLQHVVNNFVSGLILLFERPIRVGDTVVIAGEWGVIRKIGLRSTIVRSFDFSEVIVPNSDLVAEKVTNWTLSDKVARVVVAVGVAYGSDVPLVLRILSEVGKSHPDSVDQPPPHVIFVGFGDSSLNFELRIWIANADRRIFVRSELLAAVDAAFAENGVEIPFPQRDLHLRSIDDEAATLLQRSGRG